MKVATYNIWNDERGWPDRLKQIYKEIEKQNADILCLQDVPNEEHCKLLAEKGNFKFYYFKQSSTCELAILSKLPFVSKHCHSEALIGTFQMGDSLIEVMNVHLPWDSVLSCEKQVITLVNENKKSNADYSIFCGDFNCVDGSSVQNFLFGKQSLYGEEAVPVWNDLAIVYQNFTDIKPKATLDLSSNPRWKENRYKECAGTRIDWILLKETYPKPTPKLSAFGLFGTQVSPSTGYCASDHYGVFAELDFENIISTL